jgi:hypothetical protein
MTDKTEFLALTTVTDADIDIVGPPTEDQAFRLALKVALKKLSSLTKEKEELLDKASALDSEIARLRSKLATLASLVTDAPEGSPIAELKKWVTDLGLADAIREVLKAHENGLTPKEVRDWLLRMGFDLSDYSNVQASIHSILKRLHASGEIDRGVGPKGNLINLYKWSPVTFEGEGRLRYHIVPPANKRGATKRIASKK